MYVTYNCQDCGQKTKSKAYVVVNENENSTMFHVQCVHCQAFDYVITSKPYSDSTRITAKGEQSLEVIPLQHKTTRNNNFDDVD